MFWGSDNTAQERHGVSPNLSLVLIGVISEFERVNLVA